MIEKLLLVTTLWTLALANNINTRIVGGQNAIEGQFPYMVSLRDKNNEHSCGASLIDEQWVITAAHCLIGETADSLDVAVGVVQLDDEKAAIYDVVKIIVHEEFNHTAGFNDLALMKLANNVVINDNVQTLNLNSDPEDPDWVVLSGWGKLHYPGTIPNNLQFINLKPVSWDKCNETLIDSGRHVYPQEICTLNGKGQGVCYLDSGSPLVTYVKGQPVLVGVVSWGVSCAIGYPDVFTRVSSYVDWVNNTITNN